MTKTYLKSIHDLIHYTDEDGHEHLLPTDFVGEAVKVINHADHMLHAGKVYAAWGLKNSVAVDGVYDMILRTPAAATAYVYLIHSYGWVEGGQCRLQIFEKPTTATSDTAFTPINRNRLSAGTSGVEVETSGTVTIGSATQINEKVFGGGTDKKGNTGGAAGAKRAEYILDTSTTYVVRGLNKSTDSSTVSIWLLWAEESEGIET